MSKKDTIELNHNQLSASLSRWLNRRGLTGNPFERWNAENDMDLPTYFVDVGNFDEFCQLEKPSIIFAQRGCGKTAQKQMVAMECRPNKKSSLDLAISYTYSGFERVLESVNYDIDRIRPHDHVNALIYLGLTALDQEVKKDSKLLNIVKNKDLAHQWNAYTSRFAPHLSNLSGFPSTHLDKLSSIELLQGFYDILNKFGLRTCVVLVDGLDEFVYTSDPGSAIRFLAPLLGTLSIIECAGFAFKFFLPKELETLVLSCNWFRRDRIQIIPISWDHIDFLHLIEHRLIYFSRRDPKYSDLAELCDDELGAVIDKEIIELSKSLPRNLLIMADKLLRTHCSEQSPPEMIKLKSWKQVKEWWTKEYEISDSRDSFALSEKLASIPGLLDSNEFAQPVLHIVPETGVVKLGNQDIRGRFKGRIYSMLLCLYKHRGEVCNKNLIVEDVWSDVEVGDYVTDQVIAANISRLRKILEDIVPNVEYIETIKGKTRSEGGYRLNPLGFRKAA